MAKRTSLLSAALPSAQPAAAPDLDTPEPSTGEQAVLEAPAALPVKKVVREATIHIGGYFPVNDKLVIEFQKLKFDLRKSQQQMLHEALSDYVHKHRAKAAFE